ncbi:MAG TPA: DUF559 domain-containing protein [bacterium]|nr:DUF559 domain-containing protein [bacterium]
MALEHPMLCKRARRLRRDETEAERKLWGRLRARQMEDAKFRRQHLVGCFITDFCCPEHGLVIELDGGQHAMQEKSDRARSALLAKQGYRVLRFWDHEVMENIEVVLEQIARALRVPHPDPLPGRAREEGNARKRKKGEGKPVSDERGFTLLEVVVALAILSGTLVSLLVLHHRNLVLFQRATSLTQATFLAQEYLAGLTQGDKVSGLANAEGTFPGQENSPYRWQQEVEPASADGLLRIRLKVLWGEERQGEFVEFISYVAENP